MTLNNVLGLFILSTDFSDAFTMIRIPRLKESISVVGNIIDYSKLKIDILNNLVDLVFKNYYFITPSGLYRQSKGEPMGDYSSRDLDLKNCDLKAVTNMSGF